MPSSLSSSPSSNEVHPDPSSSKYLEDLESATADMGATAEDKIDTQRHRYPYCIVWTPLPLITWLFPFIGHMGICTSAGVIRDFAGPYFVSEDNMAFGNPTRYIRMDPARAQGGPSGWDNGVSKASDLYGGRIHNLCCDNCHSHVATALDMMRYDGKDNWNMVKLAAVAFCTAKYTSVGGFLKTWLPPLIIYGGLVALILYGQIA